MTKIQKIFGLIFVFNIFKQSSINCRKTIIRQVLEDRYKEEASIFKSILDPIMKKFFHVHTDNLLAFLRRRIT